MLAQRILLKVKQHSLESNQQLQKVSVRVHHPNEFLSLHLPSLPPRQIDPLPFQNWRKNSVTSKSKVCRVFTIYKIENQQLVLQKKNDSFGRRQNDEHNNNTIHTNNSSKEELKINDGEEEDEQNSYSDAPNTIKKHQTQKRASIWKRIPMIMDSGANVHAYHPEDDKVIILPTHR